MKTFSQQVREPHFWFGLVVAGGWCGVLARYLIYGDPNLDYPFPNGDFHDWIANGLHLAGYDVRTTARPPLVPLLIALLAHLGALPWLPVFFQLAGLAAASGGYLIVRRSYPPRVAVVVALTLYLSHGFQGLTLTLVVDGVAAMFLLFAALSFLRAAEDPRAYLLGGVLGAASALTQLAALLLLPAAALTLLRFRRRDLRSPWLWAGCGVFVVPVGLWLFAGRSIVDSGVVVRHWSLLRLHLDGLGTYFWAYASILGIPGMLLSVAGLARSVGRLRHDAERFFVSILWAALLIFFVFLYDYHATRFLLYPLWLGGIFLGEALVGLRRWSFAVVAGLLFLGAAFPRPGMLGDPARLTLGPAPPTYVRAAREPRPATGSFVLRPTRLAVDRFTVEEVLEASVVIRARSRYLARPHRVAFHPGLVRDDRGALFFYRSATDGGGRYRTLARLGNLLRKRVKFLPRSFFQRFGANLEPDPVGQIDIYHLYRARVRGLSGSWILAFLSPPPPAARASFVDAPALEEARRVVASVERRDGLVVVLPSGDERDDAFFYLPFLLETSDFWWIEQDKLEETSAFLDAGLKLEEGTVGEVRWRRVLVDGLEALVVAHPP